LQDRARVQRAMGNVAAAQADEAKAKDVPRNWPTPTEFILFMLAGLLIDWIPALFAIAVAVLVRNVWTSLAAAAALGAFFGLVGTRLETIDFLFSVEGWAAIWGIGLIGVALSIVASVVWWTIGRGLRAAVTYGIGRKAPPAPA
jgi:hypothetical protein